MKAEADAPWPYEVDRPAMDVAEPRWECPGGLCVCHTPGGDLPRATHHIILYDHTATRMPGGPLSRGGERPRPAGKTTRSEKLRRVEVLLYDIGYSVASRRIEREAISNQFDDPTAAAVRAFQRHHFSGRRRRFTGFGGTKGAEKSWPAAGTLDRATIQAIVETWWAVQQEPV